MVITPKNHFKQYPFVDREGHIQTFKKAVNNIGQNEFNVLVYYGVAGIGKTSLRKELPKYFKGFRCKKSGYFTKPVINITNRIFIYHKQVNNDTKSNSYSLKRQ